MLSIMLTNYSLPTTAKEPAIPHFPMLSTTMRLQDGKFEIFPVVIGIRGLMDIRHIREHQEAFGFLTIPRKEWYIGIKRFTIASVQASFHLAH
jgi:hypothetical protein